MPNCEQCIFYDCEIGDYGVLYSAECDKAVERGDDDDQVGFPFPDNCNDFIIDFWFTEFAQFTDQDFGPDHESRLNQAYERYVQKYRPDIVEARANQSLEPTPEQGVVNESKDTG